MHLMVEKLRGGIIVSCQAREGSPVYGPAFMAAFACCAQLGGAIGVRVNGPADIRAVRKAITLPIIGIHKLRTEAYPVYITPTVKAAKMIHKAGADIIAVDATERAREGGLSAQALIKAIRDETGCPVMADVDTLEAGEAAARAGADIIATTLAGYTDARPVTAGPDLGLVETLTKNVFKPVICEGRVNSPAHVQAAFEAGAFAVVVGTAITNPTAITATFVGAVTEPSRN
jgi:putative N-acetylmannosamine-6-phosphate epimerase